MKFNIEEIDTIFYRAPIDAAMLYFKPKNYSMKI